MPTHVDLFRSAPTVKQLFFFTLIVGVGIVTTGCVDASSSHAARAATSQFTAPDGRTAPTHTAAAATPLASSSVATKAAEVPCALHGVHPIKAPKEIRKTGQFMLAQIPRLAEKLPCSCCPNQIAACYRGACPDTCGPCNTIGRAAYDWHLEGLSDDDVVARVQDRYFRTL